MKKMLVGTAAIALEAKFRPFGRLASLIEKPLREKGILQEANLAQVFAKTEEILSNYLNEPSEENKRLLEAWLKFNGAIHFGSHRGMKLASELASHFLYGEGKEVNLNSLLESQLDIVLSSLSDDEFYRQDVDKAKTNSEKVALLFHTFFSALDFSTLIRGVTNGDQQRNSPDSETMTSGYYLRAENAGNTFYAGVPTKELKEKMIRAFTTVRISAGTSYFGLGRFTVGVRGKAIHASPSFGITVQNPTLYLLDTYDWKKGTDFGVDVTLGEVINALRLNSLFDDQRFEQMKKTLISLNDEDGAVLTEKGYAHKFDVIGEWVIKGEFQIENTTIVAPPLEFQRQNSVNLIRLR